MSYKIGLYDLTDGGLKWVSLPPAMPWARIAYSLKYLWLPVMRLPDLEPDGPCTLIKWG